ncbi:MAG: pyridoxal-phosphate dependent enzyme [Sphingomonadales bacterium]|nr:pyridoxal-phosphate dependent enzyme [Sphingomonadales bacterium]
MRAANIVETIGNTPHIRIQRLFGDAEVWIKSERSNPGGSIKDRIAMAMIEDAERSGKLKPGGTIIEPTSGNTGIGLAMVAAVKGYELVLVMPESMSVERRRLMLAYGAKFDLTAKEKGMKGAIERAAELIEETDGAWMPQQFEMLKRKWPDMQAFAVEPTLSPVISGGDPGPHPIQGIGAGFVPENLHTDAIDGTIQVDPEDAKEMARRAAAEEGMLVGISSGATLAAIRQKIDEVGEAKRILGFNYDTGERYLSVPDFLPEE